MHQQQKKNPFFTLFPESCSRQCATFFEFLEYKALSLLGAFLEKKFEYYIESISQLFYWLTQDVFKVARAKQPSHA